MDLAEFMLLRKVGLSFKGTEHFSNNLSHLSEDTLWVLCGFPDKSVRKKVFRQLNNRLRLNPKINKRNWESRVPAALYPKIRQFQIFFLIDSNFEIYYAAYKTIKRHKQTFHMFLLQGLVHPEEAVQANALQLLHKLFPKKYHDMNSDEILDRLPEKAKQIFATDLLNILAITAPENTFRENIIRLLGKISQSISLEPLIHFIFDGNESVRLRLAEVLRHFRDSKSIEALMTLLLDEKAIVRETAAESLRHLLPGIYTNSSPVEILESLKPIQLIELKQNSPFDYDLSRIWRKFGLSPSIIAKFLHASNQGLLKAYLDPESQRLINNRQSLFLLISARGYQFLHYLDHILQQHVYPNELPAIKALRNQLQELFAIPQADGFEILL